MKRIKYLDRVMGKVGVGVPFMKQLTAAHKASYNPKGTQKALGLADTERYKKKLTEAVAMQSLLKRAKGK